VRGKSDIVSQSSYGTGRKMVKALFDSAYVKPEHNFRVIQDSNPVKKAALNAALSRYEQDLAVKNHLHERSMAHHKEKIAKDLEALSEEMHAKKLKQRRFR
jgi:hypothetical protein